MTAGFAAVRAAADRLRPRAAVVLGSGLAGATAGFEPVAAAGFGEVPGLAAPTVAGHKGQLAVGTWAGVPVLVFSGRIHFYEGHPWDRVTRPVRLAAELGAKVLLLTNAAGGIHPSLGPGSLMAIRGHLKLLDSEGWKALSLPTFGARSVSEGVRSTLAHASGSERASPYSPRLVALLQRLAPGLFAGTYAALTGPCYETPAEIRALAVMGADAVGMSTAMEAEAAAELGLGVAGLSTVTNMAAGLGAGTLSHKEVEETARLVAGRVGELVGRFVGHLSEPEA